MKINIYMGDRPLSFEILSDEEVAVYLLTGDYATMEFTCGRCNGGKDRKNCERCGGVYKVKHLVKKAGRYYG